MTTQSLRAPAQTTAQPVQIHLTPLLSIAAIGMLVSAFLGWLCYYTYIVSPYLPFAMFD